MQTPLTAVQTALLHTQCPVCNESELSKLDSIMPDAPFLWCPNCESTIDGAGIVEKGIGSTEYLYMADVCPSSLNEWGRPIGDDTAHRWDETSSPIECAECGTHKDV